MTTLAIIFIFLGILVRFTKLGNNISPFNMLPKEDRENINIKKMAVFTGNSLMIMGALFFASHLLAIWLNQPEINDLALFGIVLTMTPYILFKANSDKYRVNK